MFKLEIECSKHFKKCMYNKIIRFCILNMQLLESNSVKRKSIKFNEQN